MESFKINDLVVYNDIKEIFVVVGIREFEIEIESETSCEWVSINKLSHYIPDGETEPEDWKKLLYRMDDNFDYCFTSYSDWKEIKDSKFHELRKNYLESAKRLNNYVENKVGDIIYE